jgi:hypothetical protein
VCQVNGVRWADREEGRSPRRDRMAKKRMPVGRKATGNRDPVRRLPPLVSDNRLDTGLVPGLKGSLAR